MLRQRRDFLRGALSVGAVTALAKPPITRPPLTKREG